MFKPFRKFGKDATGSVKIEFVLILPVLLTWILGAYVFFDAYKTYNRSAKASFAISDIMSRKLEVDFTTIMGMHDLLDGLVPWSDNDKWLRISSISFDGDNYEVQWSHASGISDVLATESLTDEMIARLPDIAENDTVILTETGVPYRPLLKAFGLNGLTWRNEIAVRPRYVMEIASNVTD